MKKKVKFNQCQDCGCPGGQLMLITLADNTGVVSCPYCKRRGVPYILDEYGYAPEKVIVESWNIRNRDNEEGLA